MCTTEHVKPYRGSSNTMSQGRSGKLNMENHGTGRTMAGPTVAGSSGMAHGNKNMDQIRLKRMTRTEKPGHGQGDDAGEAEEAEESPQP